MRSLIFSWLFFMPILACFFVINVILVSGQCQSDQKALLLQMRNSLIYDSTFSVNLARWDQSTDCCQWNGVDCDAAGRVIGLNLSYESISGGIENSTALFSFKYLQNLNLAYNRFNGTHIPSQLDDLPSLTYLNLSYADFGGQIPLSVSSLTKLVTLDLSTFASPGIPPLTLENPNLTTLVRDLRELKELHLDGVDMSTNGNEWAQALSSSLPNLHVLSLSDCFLSGPIDPSLANLQSLSEIRLDQNNLSSTILDLFADLSNLTSLNLRLTGLSGRCPEKIFLVPTLQTLDLSGNEFLHGFLPEFLQHSSLQTLIVSGTNFSGNLSESIGNLKNLSSLELVRCNFTGKIPISMANLTQLVYLSLSYNQLTGEISSTGWDKLLNLVHVDLSFNSFYGRIPASLFSIPLLQDLWLQYNKFQGQVPEFSNATSSVLSTLDLSANNLEGPIPISIFELQKIYILSLSSNRFNGTVNLDRIQRLSNLRQLDLSDIRLVENANHSVSSSFPPLIETLDLASCSLPMIPNLNNLSNLDHLDLSNNQIHGEIPNWIWGVGDGRLYYLNLSHNFLTGLQEPYSIPELTVIDLNSNQLHGKIPQSPSTARYVDYSRNKFTSSIPDSLCYATLLQFLDLSHNNLSGRIPKCLFERSETLQVLDLTRNNLNGSISDTFPVDCALQTLDVSGNHLRGKIPQSLSNCTKLEVLDLGNNQIHDKFPCWLKSITTLCVLVLRSNKFYGTIGCLKANGTWPLLQIFNLAYNNFSGNIPSNSLKTWGAMRADEDEAQARLKHLNVKIFQLAGLYYFDAVTVASKGLHMDLVKIPTIFTAIDLSSNNFEGPIPEDIRELRSLYVLNLSHNALTGQIPSSLGNMRQLESLDLSMNKLSGKIPSALASLNFLSFLNVSHNNLIGRIPSGTQIQTQQPSSFGGNPGLYGPPLENERTIPSTRNDTSASISGGELNLELLIGGVGFVIGFVICFWSVVISLMCSVKANKWCDNRINRFLKLIRR